jgi:hypothetical protein
MKYTEDLESPTSFFYWSAITCVAGALRDNVFLPQKKSNLFPNLYTLLLADSGIDRKGTPLGVACDILNELHNTKIIRGRTSVQGILKVLGEQEMDRESGVSTSGGSCFLCAEELASFFVTDPQAIPLITDIYDYRREWTSNLKGEGKVTIKNLCVTMLAASNETHLREVYSNLAVYGGLLGRTLFVKSDGRRPPNAMFGDDLDLLKYEEAKKELVCALKDISILRGPFEIQDEAKTEYVTWYKHLYKNYGNKTDKSGIIARIHTTVAKVAMILAVANTRTLYIMKHHVEEAISQCIKLLPNYDIFVMASGKGTLAEAGSFMLNELLTQKSITKGQFLKKYWTEVDDELFENMAKTLEQAKLITYSIEGNKQVFILTDEGKERLNGKRMGG